MNAEPSRPPSEVAAHIQLRRCLLTVADLLAEGGHVLETITLPRCGLAKREMKALEARGTGWSVCRKTLEASAAGGINPEGRFVLTALGREVLFDLFGQGAADCA